MKHAINEDDDPRRNNLPVTRDERFLKDTAPPIPDTCDTHSFLILFALQIF